MADSGSPIELTGIVGKCGARDVFLGIAPASLLHRLSFADVLDEAQRDGYQRRFSEDHSLEFRRYIQQADSTTIPLTFNLRPPGTERWTVQKGEKGVARLVIRPGAGKVLSQVDCQHRIGHLADQDVPLAFMTFIGLDSRAEMEIFSRINSKAKGLSSSLLDFHESRMSLDVAKTNPGLFVALQLNEVDESPWFQSLDLGGKPSVGMTRRASLRTMQKAARRFIREGRLQDPHRAAKLAIGFWRAIKTVLSREWKNQRQFLVTKGVGVYSLMSIAGDLVREADARNMLCDEHYFAGTLSDFVGAIDWSRRGVFQGFGGVGGADQATDLLRKLRAQRRLKVVGRA